MQTITGLVVGCRQFFDNIHADVNRLVGIEDRLNDAEDRSRHCNLVFYGVREGESESWADSEKLGTNICRDNLKITLELQDIQRVHRIGRITTNKSRPIIVICVGMTADTKLLDKCQKRGGERERENL